MLTTPQSSENGPWPAIIVLAITHRARRKVASLSGLSRQRFSALAQMRPQLMSAVPRLREHKRTYRCIVALCNWCRRDGIVWLAPHRPLVAKVSLALVQPSLLIRYSQRTQVLRSRACIVHPIPE